MAKGVTGNLLVDSHAPGPGLDVIAHYGAQPERLFTSFDSSPLAICGKYPIRRVPIRCFLMPGHEVLGQVVVYWDRFPGNFCFRVANPLINNRSGNVEVELLEADVLPLEARQLAATETQCHVEEYHGPLPNSQ